MAPKKGKKSGKKGKKKGYDDDELVTTAVVVVVVVVVVYFQTKQTAHGIPKQLMSVMKDSVYSPSLTVDLFVTRQIWI